MEAWERFHKVECQQLDLILDPTVGKMGMLAMRILTSSGKIYLEYVITKVREEMESRQDTHESPRLIGFNEEGVYDAADYRTVYTLVTNRFVIVSYIFGGKLFLDDLNKIHTFMPAKFCEKK